MGWVASAVCGTFVRLLWASQSVSGRPGQCIVGAALLTEATCTTSSCQDACPQHRVIAAGLRQRTATRHVEQEPREWHRTHWPGWFVRPPILQVPLSYDNSFTGCRFANELPTRYRWSHTRREPPAPQLTCPISSTTTYRQEHRYSDKTIFLLKSYSALKFVRFFLDHPVYRPSFLFHAPPIRPRLMALYKCALIDWLIDWCTRQIDVRPTSDRQNHRLMRPMGRRHNNSGTTSLNTASSPVPFQLGLHDLPLRPLGRARL